MLAAASRAVVLATTNEQASQSKEAASTSCGEVRRDGGRGNERGRRVVMMGEIQGFR